MSWLFISLGYAIYFWIGCYEIEIKNKKAELSQKMRHAMDANP